MYSLRNECDPYHDKSDPSFLENDLYPNFAVAPLRRNIAWIQINVIWISVTDCFRIRGKSLLSLSCSLNSMLYHTWDIDKSCLSWLGDHRYRTLWVSPSILPKQTVVWTFWCRFASPLARSPNEARYRWNNFCLRTGMSSSTKYGTCPTLLTFFLLPSYLAYAVLLRCNRCFVEG